MSNQPLLNIGVLDTPMTTPDYLRRFFDWGYPDKITPGKRSGKFEIVIIPDMIGAYVGMKCFQGRYNPIGLRRMDNMAELFRIHERGLKYYAENSLVVGVGEGAVMLWDYLGHKCTIKGEIAEIKLNRDPEIQFDDLWRVDDLFVSEWRIKNFVGVDSLWSPTLTGILQGEMAKMREDMQQLAANNIRRQIKTVSE